MCVYIHIHTYMYIYIYVCVYIHIYTYMYISTYTRTCIYSHIHIYVYIRIYTCIYIHMCVYLHIHVCVFTYVCVYIYVCVSPLSRVPSRQVITQRQAGVPLLYSSFPPALCSIHGSLYTSELLSQFAPPSPSPAVSHKSVLYVCVSTPACKQVHQYHFRCPS